ncbi:MAG: type IX secretion system sortase PorU [Bacteroidota bacterium]|nr:type IX secretion system sortase PorU [Bacteroidota bacterium]
MKDRMLHPDRTRASQGTEGQPRGERHQTVSRRDTKTAVLLAAILLLAGGAKARAQEIRLLSSDASGCTIEYRPEMHVHAFSTPGGTFTCVTFEGAAPLYPALAGAPDTKYRALPLGLPGLEGHRVTILESDFTDSSGVLLIPVPTVRRRGGDVETSWPRGPLYDEAGFRPAEAASLVDIGISRHRFLGMLRLFPMLYDARAMRLRMIRRMVVRVDFGPPDPSLTYGGKAETFGLAPLNDDIASRWVLGRMGPLGKRTTTPKLETPLYRFEVGAEGIYRLNAGWFRAAGIDPAGIDPRTIRVFGHGGNELPARLGAPRPDDMQEIAIEVTGEEDGRFDEGDEVRFYGRGTVVWSYDSASRRYVHSLHRFAKSNAYLLTFGGERGKRMQKQISLNEPTAYRPPWFTGREFHEEDAVNFFSSGKLWVGRKINPTATGSSQVVLRRLEGLVRTEPVRYRIALYAQSEVAHSFLVSDGFTLGSIPMGTVNFDTDRDDIASFSGVRLYERPGNLPDDRSTVKVEYFVTDPNRSRGGYIDWIEWNYAHRFTAVSDVLLFNSPDTSAVCAFEVGGFSSSDVRVYDVTDHADVRLIDGMDVSGGTVRFQAEAVSGRPRQYIAAAVSAFGLPGPPERAAYGDLHGSRGAACIIITDPALQNAAEMLRAHRERPGDDAIPTRVVTLPEIYNEFNGGVADPAAIRNFLAFAFRNWEITPRYVLLLGDGHFDYRNITTNEKIVVPVWESENSINLIGSYVTDDFFAQVSGDDPLVDLAIGRLPVRTAAEAEDVVRKIISYETQPAFGAWKNRVTLVADDGFTTRTDEGSVHTAQSEDISRILPLEIEQKKIYIVSYPTENTAQGRRKPSANSDLIDQINAGTVIVNYTGHGSDAVWAHEQIFVTDVTVPQLENADRLTFVAAATCTFGLYDRPELVSGTERLILKPDGGAIGGLSAPRVVYSGQNSIFNQTFFTNLVAKGREPDGRVKRIGDAVFATKQQWYSDPGYEKFHLFADPAMRLALPRYRCTVDSILVNGVRAEADTVQFRALSRVMIAASVRRPDSTVWTDFSGSAEVSLYDAQRRITVPLDGWGGFSYTVLGGLLFRGDVTIRDGIFSISLIIPKDISYENSTGRLAMYFHDGVRDGAGYCTSFRIGGSDSSSGTDTRGPEIALYLDTRTFAAGDPVGAQPLLIADLSDESGINTTGLGIGHNIEAWLDGEEVGTVLNDYYRGERDSYQRGTVEYRYRDLPEGKHTLRLRAWDIYNNPSMAETWFTVHAGGLTLGDVFVYPNPITSGGATFGFTHNRPGPVNVELKIYTLAGRVIRKLEARDTAERSLRIFWDGTDDDGDRPANGTYFYKLMCTSVDGKEGSERIGTISIIR